MSVARHWVAPLLFTAVLGPAACAPGDNRSSADARVTDAPEYDARPTPPDPFDARPTPPDTLVTLAPPALTNQPARIEFTSTIPDSTFTCALDGAAPMPCTSPFTPALADGGHALVVTATSPAGVADSSPATAAWTLDTVAPVTLLVVAPPAIDNSASATFQFTSEPAASFACALDGAPFAPCTSPHHTAVLADGDHVFEVRATDLAGNAEATPRHHAWTRDGNAPDTVIDSGPPAATTATAATFTFASPDAGPGATFTCALDGLAPVACTSPWTLTDLPDGDHAVHIAVRDAAGNVDPSPAAAAWRVDTTPPTVTITGGPSGPASDATPTFTFTVAGAPVITECRITGSVTTPFAPCAAAFTSPALPDGDAAFEVRVVDELGLASTATRAFAIDTVAPEITIASAPSGIIVDSQISVTFTVNEPATATCALDQAAPSPCDATYQTAVLVDGAHRITIAAVDAAGNPAVPVVRTFRRDTLPPVVTITGPSGLTPFGVTGESAPLFGLQVVDAGSATTRTCQLDSLPVVTPCPSLFTAPTLADGDHALTVTAVDAVGHVGVATRAFTIDSRPIAIAITSSPPAVSANPQPTISYATTGAITALACQVDDGPWGDCPGGLGTWTVAPPLADGTHQLGIRVAGPGIVASTYTPSFVIDTTP